VPQPIEVNDATIYQPSSSRVGRASGNHLATLHAPRRRDLWLHKTNNTYGSHAQFGFGVAGAHSTPMASPCANQRAVGAATKALFSTGRGAPRNATDTNIFIGRFYESTGLPDGPYASTNFFASPPITTMSSCYLPAGESCLPATGPRDGSPHLYPQLRRVQRFPT